MRELFGVVTVVAATIIAGTAGAQTYEIRVTNLTGGQIISPAVVATHSAKFRMFKAGKKASAALAALAEDADTSGLTAALDAAGAEVTDWAMAGGPLLPGATQSVEVTVAEGDYLSLAAMLVTTNDAFAGLDSYDLSNLDGRHSFAIPAYDAGSEANNESCDSIPGPPCGSGGVRARNGREGFVHIHPGIRGDGDVSSVIYDWRNPVMKVEIRPAK